MGKYWPIIVLTVLILTVCSSEAQEQYQIPSSYLTFFPSSGADESTPEQYSEYYTMAATSFPGKHIMPPERYELAGNMPSKIYSGNLQQPVPYSQYQTYATYTAGNTLWIQGTTSWTQSAVIPQGAFLSLIAVSPTSATPTGVSGDLYEINPDGVVEKNSYTFYPYSRFGFYADKIGRHILFYMIDGKISNPIVIEVVSYTPPPLSYPYPTNYYVPAYYYYLDLFKVCPYGGQFCNGYCCPPGQSCVNGVCQPIACPDGRQKCSGQCCPQDKTCVNGICQPLPCPDGRQKCSGQCCPQGKTCVDGVCQSIPCPGGCPQGKTCVDGVCQPIPCLEECPGNQICVGGQCCPEVQKCGDMCCPPGHCVDGLCCPTGQKCGDECCPQGQTA